MAKRYKLRCQLLGHEKDVRAVCASILPDGGVVSASRDCTARVWSPNDHGTLQEGLILSGHSNFVAAVTVTPPDDNHPHGLIYTGSYDNHIYAFTLDSPQPQFKLSGHTNSVCSLAAGKFGTLLSGSWDASAKVWLNKKCVMTLEGHENAVWAVAVMPEAGFMLTGSADKTIKMWRAGRCEKTFRGHEDCVRGLIILNSSEFLSCSNDASVRRWSTSGECIRVHYGHSNFVYSLALLPNGQDFVTGSEDRSLRVWEEGECVQTITHPTESVWSVCVLPNGDIVSGASDGVVRVFTRAEERAAVEEEQKAFEEQVAGSAIPAQLGDIKAEDLPGPEALYNPGKRDGQTMMVKDGNKIMAHQWSAAEGRWTKIGDVVGSSGGSQATSGKVLYEGKEYDYVFDVELDEGSPLKLPYNTSEDPWFAAQRFIHKHELPQLFLDQIAKFIMDNAKGVTLGQAQSGNVDPFTGASSYSSGGGTAQAPSSGVDPFTGAGRYVPSYSEGSTGGTTHGADPFTGGSSYNPSSEGAKPQKTSNPYFPKTTFLSFDTANTSAITGKLAELNNKVPEGQQLEAGELKQMEGLMDGASPTAQQLNTLWKILQWPADVVFPALDTLRLAVRSAAVNQHFCNDKDGSEFLQRVLSFITPASPPANQMLGLRTLTNCFKHPPGEKLLVSSSDTVITSALSCHDNKNKNIQIAACSVMLNMAVSFRNSPDIEAKSQCLSAAVTMMNTTTDPEGMFRLLVCVGTLVWEDLNSVELAKSLGVMTHLSKCKSIPDPKKVGECASAVISVLNSS